MQGNSVVMISETWLNQDDSDASMEINGYHMPIRRDRNAENRGGGVAIYM